MSLPELCGFPCLLPFDARKGVGTRVGCSRLWSDKGALLSLSVHRANCLVGVWWVVLCVISIAAFGTCMQQLRAVHVWLPDLSYKGTVVAGACKESRTRMEENT